MPTAKKRLKTQPGLVALAVSAFASQSLSAGTDLPVITVYALPVLPAGAASQPVDNRFEGRSLLHDNAVIASAFNAKGRKVPLDVGHLTEWDGAAPAVGWVRELYVAEDGSLWAWCEMTADGEALVDGKKFGYTSPTLRGVYTDTGDWMALSLKSLALTNNPALEMSSTFTAEGDEDEADEETVQDTQALTTEAPTEAAPAAVEATEQTEGTVTPAETAEALSAATPPLVDINTQTVALSAFVELQGTVETLTAQRDEARTELTALTTQVESMTADIASLTAARDEATTALAALRAEHEAAAVSAAIDAANIAGKTFPFERPMLTAYAATHGLEKLNEYIEQRLSSGKTPSASTAGTADDEVPADVAQYLSAAGSSLLDGYRRARS